MPGPAVPGCSLLSFHFLLAILCPQAVYVLIWQRNNTKNSFQILPGLYVGNLKDSRDARLLDMHGITHILSIYDEAKKLFRVSADFT